MVLLEKKLITTKIASQLNQLYELHLKHSEISQNR